MPETRSHHASAYNSSCCFAGFDDGNVADDDEDVSSTMIVDVTVAVVVMVLSSSSSSSTSIYTSGVGGALDTLSLIDVVVLPVALAVVDFVVFRFDESIIIFRNTDWIWLLFFSRSVKSSTGSSHNFNFSWAASFSVNHVSTSSTTESSVSIAVSSSWKRDAAGVAEAGSSSSRLSSSIGGGDWEERISRLVLRNSFVESRIDWRRSICSGRAR